MVRTKVVNISDWESTLTRFVSNVAKFQDDQMGYVLARSRSGDLRPSSRGSM